VWYGLGPGGASMIPRKFREKKSKFKKKFLLNVIAWL
jgi:hypothetical protein